MDERSEVTALVQKARALGAKGAEALRTEREILEQTESRGRPTTRKELGYSVRVWREGGAWGLGRALTGAAALTAAWEDSARRAPDPLAGPAERMAIRTGGLGIDDRRHEQLGDEDRGEVLHLAERALNGAPFRPEVLRYSQVRESRAWASSRGLDTHEYATTYLLHAEVRVLGDIASHSIASRHFSDVASLPFGTELRRRVEPLMRQVTELPALPVVLEPRVMGELARALAPAFTADRVREGRSFLSGRVGQRLAPSLLHLTDDAGLFGGLYTRGFDDRGVPPIAVTLLKEGIVNGLFHDPESARAEGLRPTGHVRDGQLRPANLIVRPGARTRNVILSELGSYLQLDRIPTLDVATGRLHGRVPVVVVEKGERRGAKLVDLDMPVERFLGCIAEMIADHERSLEVDTPSAVFQAAVLDGVR